MERTRLKRAPTFTGNEREDKAKRHHPDIGSHTNNPYSPQSAAHLSTSYGVLEPFPREYNATWRDDLNVQATDTLLEEMDLDPIIPDVEVLEYADRTTTATSETSFEQDDSVHSAELYGDEKDHAGPDTCFGVIMSAASSTFKAQDGDNTVAVNINAFGGVLRLTFMDSSKSAGMVVLPAVNAILERLNIRLSATLVAPKRAKNGKSEELGGHQVRIVVYGRQEEKDAVGDILSEGDVYLQHPLATDLDMGMRYDNPHYLLRPGARMPELGYHMTMNGTDSASSPNALDEARKSQIMQIFDSATLTLDTPISVSASPRLRSTLKDHQLTALEMMIEKERGGYKECKFPSLWVPSKNSGDILYRHTFMHTTSTAPPPACGGILADEMGLGKTLSLLALVCSTLDILDSPELSPDEKISRTTLIVVPMSTIPGWRKQIQRHIHDGKVRTYIHHGSKRAKIGSEGFRNYDIVFTTYDTLRSEWTNNGKIYNTVWHRLVLDEAHHARNRNSQTFKAVYTINAYHRWCLTGTPIQNSLDDYGALLSIIRATPFTEKSAFDFWVTNPVEKNTREGLETLKHVVMATCLRRTKDMIQGSLHLPPKHEEIESVELSRPDREIYDFFKAKAAKKAQRLASQRKGLDLVFDNVNGSDDDDDSILSMINRLRMICDHGLRLLPMNALRMWTKHKNTGTGYMTEQGLIGSPNDNTNPQTTATSSQPPVDPHMRGDSSSKIQALLKNLYTEQASNSNNLSKPSKSVIFSYWTRMLNIIQETLDIKGFLYVRIDGQTNLKDRYHSMSEFTDNPRCTIMLASIGSTAEGVDLAAGNYVHIMEPQWNPMVEAQAVDRVHRIGQTRDVFIRRYITKDSIENYVQSIQQDKIKIIKQSLTASDKAQADRDQQRLKYLESILNH